MQYVTFNITSGLPFGRDIEVTLPNGRTWWTVGNEFEVLGQIRKGETEETDLILDLASHMTMTFTSPDTVDIELRLDGATTRIIKENGFYDIVLSDNLTADDIAFPIVKGKVNRSALVTAATEALDV